jgi:hypothetical protein
VNSGFRSPEIFVSEKLPRSHLLFSKSFALEFAPIVPKVNSFRIVINSDFYFIIKNKSGKNYNKNEIKKLRKEETLTKRRNNLTKT